MKGRRSGEVCTRPTPRSPTDGAPPGTDRPWLGFTVGGLSLLEAVMSFLDEDAWRDTAGISRMLADHCRWCRTTPPSTRHVTYALVKLRAEGVAESRPGKGPKREWRLRAEGVPDG